MSITETAVPVELPARDRRLAGALRRTGLIAVPLLAGIVVATHGPGLARSLARGAQLQPVWVVLACLAMVAVYTCSWRAVSMASREELPWRQTFAVQLAGVYLDRVVPAGIGSKVVNARYLNRRGVDLPRAAAAMTTVAAGDTIAAALLGVLATGYLTTRHIVAVSAVIGPVTSRGPLLVAAAAAMIGTAMLPPCRRRLASLLSTARAVRLREQARLYAGHLRSQRRHVRPVTSVMVVERITYATVFLLVVRAAGGHIGVAVGLGVYLVSSLAASVIPVAGGLGATELALTTGLHDAGMHAAAAATAVLAFRVISYWAPAIPGVVAYRSLRRSHAV